MASETVRYELTDKVAVITLDDGKVNAVSPAVISTLNAYLDRAEGEASAVMLCGRAGRFSGGFDLSVMTGSLDGMRDLVTTGAELLLRIYSFPRPVIAACTGHALAMGALLLVVSDQRIGARGDYKIGLNEVSIHLPLPVFGMELARDRLSKRHFTQATSQARIYDPETAIDAGYLDATEDADKLFAAALQLAGRMTALPHPAFRETKRRERTATIDYIRRTLVDDVAQLTTPVPNAR
jgi:enoyl-CoA hydratase